MFYLLDVISHPEHYKYFFYSRNQIIFNEQDRCEGIYIIIQGEVSIRTYNFYEQEYTITTLLEKASFGESLLFSHHPYYLGTIIANKATTLLYISKVELLQLFNEPSFVAHFLLILSEKNLENQFKIKILLQKQIKEKILFYLSEKQKQLHSPIIPIPSKEYLAKFLNVPRPSLSRALIQMRAEKLIDFNRKTIFLLDNCKIM